MKTYYFVKFTEFGDKVKYIFRGRKFGEFRYQGRVEYSFYPNREKDQNCSPHIDMMKKLTKGEVVKYKLLGYI